MRLYLLVLAILGAAACASTRPDDRAIANAPPAPAGISRDTTVYEEDDVNVKPHLINQQEVARAMQQHLAGVLGRAGQTGRLMYRVVIDERGRVATASVLHSSGDFEVDQAARRVIDRMRFAPARIDGRPVRIRVDMPIEFRTP